jgi:transposase
MKKQLTVGVDVAEAKFDIAFRNPNGQPVRQDASFDNSPEGIRDFIGCCIASASLIGKRAKIIVGMESTSNFHKNLANALYASSRKIEVHIINPLAVKQFKKMHLKVYKTDKLDAHMIALYLIKMTPKPSFQSLPGQEELKELTRLRRSFQEETTKFKNRLRRLLRIHFPGYKRLLGSKISMKFLIAFSNFASPDKILAQEINDIANFKVSCRHKIGISFASKLIKLAKKAPVQSIPDATAMVINWTAQRLLQLKEQIETLDKEIVSMLEVYFPEHNLHSVPGIGPISIATIIAEVGDVKRFSSPEKFIGYVGLYPVVWESGQMKARFQMTRKGNKSLKMAFLVASAAARRFNPVIRNMYDRLRSSGKSKKAAGGAVSRKLACIVYAILYSNEAWDPRKAMAGMEKSQQMAEAYIEKKKGNKNS